MALGDGKEASGIAERDSNFSHSAAVSTQVLSTWSLTARPTPHMYPSRDASGTRQLLYVLPHPPRSQSLHPRYQTTSLQIRKSTSSNCPIEINLDLLNMVFPSTKPRFSPYCNNISKPQTPYILSIRAFFSSTLPFEQCFVR